MTREEAVKMLQATRLMLMDGANQPISDLYYALDMAIEALEQTENCSEKPNNCEPQTDCNGCKFVGTYDTEFPCATCSRKTKDYYAKTEPQTEEWQDWKDKMWSEAIVTEPQTDCAWK